MENKYIYYNRKLKFNKEDEGIGRRMFVVKYLLRFAKSLGIDNNGH